MVSSSANITAPPYRYYYFKEQAICSNRILIYKVHQFQIEKKTCDESLRCLIDLLTIWQFISHVSNFISNTINSKVIPKLSKLGVIDG